MSNYNWSPIMGRMERADDSIIFKGGKIPIPNEDKDGAEIGLFLCDQTFSEGSISVNIKFDTSSTHSAAEIVLYYDPQTKLMLTAGLSQLSLYIIRDYSGIRYNNYAFAGAAHAIEANKTYTLEVQLHGSTITLICDGVVVLRTTLPFVMQQSQVGVFAMDFADITFSNYRITPIKPKAFVVMQFSSPYNEVYSEAIKIVCDEVGVDVKRIDEQSGPGLIIKDIATAIQESKIVIADISPTPPNANVFYEVGYAHALNKPTILIAEKGTKLPLDVSPFRTLFYENSWEGKRRFEEGLRNHITAILGSAI